VFERLRLNRALRIMKTISMPLVIMGVILSTLHQSSLGSLYLIVPNKLHPFWYSPLLPVFFFLSSIAIGLAMTIFESNLSAKYFKRQLEFPLLQEMGRILAVILILYGVLRLQDLYHREALKLLAVPGPETWLFLLEIVMGLLLPIALLLTPKVRNSPGGLYFTATMTILGFILNRLNVSITGMEWSLGVRYLPKWTEAVVTLAIVASGFAIFSLATKYLPIFPPETEEHSPEAVTSAG
jgi:Ni/Fe-hydrogenase subunit HybB-like protein